MTYTLWSRGRLLGQTELAYRQAIPGLRAGDFFPNELGERLMPIIDGVGPALMALSDTTEAVLRTNPSAHREDDWPAGVRQTTQYADAMSITDELESLRLELRDSAGAVVETQHLWLRDTHRLIALGQAVEDRLSEEMTDEMRAEIDEEVAEMLGHLDPADEAMPWERDSDDDPDDEAADWPRYQIFVCFPEYQPFGRPAYPTD